MNTLKFITLAAFVTLTTMSCSSDDDAPVLINEQEVITTTIVNLTASGQPTVTLTSRDVDGDGPGDPIVEVSGNLQAGITYTGTIQLLNETESPAENITTEVRDEALEHQFFYQVSSGLNVTTSYSDMDADGNPIGINFSLTTGQPSSGSFTVILRHEPNKSAAGVADGDITNAGGETDVSQTFNITIE